MHEEFDQRMPPMNFNEPPPQMSQPQMNFNQGMPRANSDFSQMNQPPLPQNRTMPAQKLGLNISGGREGGANQPQAMTYNNLMEILNSGTNVNVWNLKTE